MGNSAEQAPLAARLSARIGAGGSIGFDEWCEAALYDPAAGFYTAGVGAAGGRTGDFLTSPEVGPLFGAVIARAVTERWNELGCPNGFTVVEAAAGRGALARSVQESDPAWLATGRWIMVEPSPVLRSAADDLLGNDVRFPSVASIGDVRAEVDGVGDVGLVLANELLDNLPVVLVERRADGWAELRVTQEPGEGSFRFGVSPVSAERARRAEILAPGATLGSRIPLAEKARRWATDALALFAAGTVVLIDYATPTPMLADRPMDEWVRTYAGHDRAGSALESPGHKDITVEVPLDQFDDPPPAEVMTQADFLRRHGLDELVAEGRRVWHERAHLGDLTALRARSRVREGEALTDPAGLGAFTVLRWDLPAI